MDWTLHNGHAVDLLADWERPLDLVCTDPPYAFGGCGTEHAVSATVAIALRETAAKLRRGCWMIVLSATSWRSISYVVEACRNVVEPVRIATWTKPTARTKVKPIGWRYASVAAIAFRRGPKNHPGLVGNQRLDYIEAPTVTDGRRAELPATVARWAVEPFAIPGGLFLDPFAGSGALPRAAASYRMEAHGFELEPPQEG